MRAFPRPALLALAIVVSLPAAASAETLPADADGTRTLDAVDVRGVRVQGYAAPVTNVGLKLPVSQRETPQSVSVLTRALLDDLAADGLDEAILFVPGVALRQYDSIDTQYIARGFEITNYQLDGLPATLGRAKPRLAMYDRVEVLRGAAGLLNGAGDPGGVVNLVRKHPTAELAGNAEFSAGSWNRYRVLGDVGGPLNVEGSLRGRAVVEHEDKDLFQRGADYRYTLGYGVLETDISDDGRFSVGVSYEKLQTTPVWSGLPRHEDGRALDVSPRTALEPAWQDVTTQGRQLFAELDQGLGENWRLRVSAQYARENGRYLVGNGWGAIADDGSGWSITPTLQYRDYGNQSLDAAVLGGFQAWGRQHDVIVGANWNRSNTDASGLDFAESWAIADVHAFDPHALPRPTQLLQDSYWSGRYTTTQEGVYSVLRLRPAQRLTALLGLRYSRWNDDGLELEPVAWVSSDYGDTHLGGYAGLVYELDAHWSLYASYADVFQVQSERGIDGQLPPMQGDALEAGVKGDWFDGALNASFAVFDIRQKDRAQLDASQLPGACNGDNCYVAQGEVSSRGFEATLAGRIAEGVDVSAGYTWNKQEYSRDADLQGQPFNTWAPKQMLRLWASWRPQAAADWSFGLGASWQTETEASGGIAQPAYALWHARAGYRFDARWSLALNVDNLFDKDYWQTVGPTGWGNFRGEPRSATATVRYRF